MAKRRTRKTEQRLDEVRRALAEERSQDAWSSARNLLASHKRDARVLSLAGAAAFQIGDKEQARALLSDAVQLSPKDPHIQMNLGNVLASLGNPSGAFAAYQAAHDLSVDYPEPAFNAGVLFASEGDHINAAIWFQNALARDAAHVAAAIGLGDALKNAGNLHESKRVLEKLVVSRPDDPIAHTNLAATFSALGDDIKAKDAASRAVELDPGLAAAHYNLGVAEQALGDDALAVTRFRQTLALEPMNAAAALNLGEAYLRLGDRANATSAFKRALDIDPGFAMAAVNLADLDLDDGRPPDALDVMDQFLSRNPGQPNALAFKAFALRDMGEVGQALELDSPARFIFDNPFDIPDGYEDIEAFNEALAAHVLAHPSLTVAPKAHATVAGQHSGELLGGDLGPIADLRDIVLNGFNTYRRRFIGEPAHPFLDQCPKEVQVSIWGVVMREAGHQVPHIHPAAWLSGVYYVDVPGRIRKDDPAHEGWLEFGRPPQDIHAKHVSDVKLICPIAGRMILFPSHFYHRTIPLRAEIQRISIAFDLIASK